MGTMASLPDLSVQLYSVRQALAQDFAGTLSRLAGLGLTRVEPYRMLEFAEKLKEVLPAAGLTAPTAHQALDGGDLDAIFRSAALLGVRTVVHPFTPADHWQSRADIQQLADTLREAATVASDHGVMVAYHNHAWELSTQIDGRPALELFADMLDPAVQLEIDTYWAATGGEDVPALLRRLGARVFALHLKDGPLNGDIAAQVPLGSGDLPVAEIIAAASGLQYPVLEFDAYAGDMFDGITASYAYARNTLGARR
jgi:sugar phosphate isomerase/epimerase